MNPPKSILSNEKKQIRAWKAVLKQRVREVAVVRDTIRDDISDMESLAECCDRAYDDMQRAIEALSELA